MMTHIVAALTWAQIILATTHASAGSTKRKRAERNANSLRSRSPALAASEQSTAPPKSGESTPLDRGEALDSCKHRRSRKPPHGRLLTNTVLRDDCRVHTAKPAKATPVEKVDALRTYFPALEFMSGRVKPPTHRDATKLPGGGTLGGSGPNARDGGGAGDRPTTGC